MDGTENQQDISSEGEQGTSGKPPTFTEEQVRERERKVKSDALSEVGRLRKSAEAALESARKAQERLDQMVREQDEAELETHKDEPEVISAIKERQKRRLAESKLADRERELNEERAKAQEAKEADAQHTKERNAREVASRLNVDVNALIKFTDGSVEAMEELAKSLPRVGESKPLLIADSGKTTGGGIAITSENIKDPVFYAKHRKEILEAMSKGLIK